MAVTTSSREPCKCLLVIQDGIGDRPLEALGGMTPLEAASTPHMDTLIRQGSAGSIDIIAPGVTVGTDIGHLALFGQDVGDNRSRRGPLEAAGLGMILGPDEVALRCNFATVDDDLQILDRRSGRIRQGTDELAETVNQMRIADDVELVFRAATEHRAVLILRGEDLSEQISDSDPGSLDGAGKVLEVVPQTDHFSAKRTAQLVNKFVRESHRLLKEHPLNRRRLDKGELPANVVLTRGAGSCRTFDQLADKWGRRVGCVSGECTVLGIARLSGADTIVTSEMTANLDTNLMHKGEKAIEALRDHDLVYLHLKGCDVAGHDRQPERKKWFVEQTDLMVGEVLRELAGWKNLHFAFAGDHSTPCELGEHSSDPVPVFLSGENIPVDEVSTYGERSCAQGALGRIRCQQFLTRILDCLGV